MAAWDLMLRDEALHTVVPHLMARFALNREWTDGKDKQPQQCAALLTNASPGFGKTFLLTNLADRHQRRALITQFSVTPDGLKPFEDLYPVAVTFNNKSRLDVKFRSFSDEVALRIIFRFE